MHDLSAWMLSDVLRHTDHCLYALDCIRFATVQLQNALLFLLLDSAPASVVSFGAAARLQDDTSGVF